MTDPKPLVASHAIQSKETYADDWRRWSSMIKSGALPKSIRTPEMAITIAAIGELYGWDARRSIMHIHLVDGRPTMDAESMMALIVEHVPEAKIQPLVMSAKEVSVSVQRRPDLEPVVIRTTIEQFKHLASRGPWKMYPEDMLWARCVSRIGRRIFPDVIGGAYTTGELEEATMRVTQGPAKVDLLGPDELELDREPLDHSGEHVAIVGHTTDDAEVEVIESDMESF